MNRIGVFDSIRIGGSTFLFSGKESAGILSTLFQNTEKGILTESFVLDLSPSGLVRAYDHAGLWKLRFVEFSLTAQGVSLSIFRPPKKSVLGKSAAVADYSAANQLFADLIAAGKAHVKSSIVLSPQQISVKKMKLAEPSRSDAASAFSLHVVDSIRGVDDKARIVNSVVQVQLEGSGYLEFFGRDDDHVEKWMQRARFLSCVHRAFHSLQKVVLNEGSFPAKPGNYDEFVVTVPGTSFNGARSMLQVSQTGTSFSVCIVSQPTDADLPVFWRVCIDENPLLEPNSICFPVIMLTAAEQDRVSVNDDSCLASKEACWLSLESLSQASLGKLFYYNKWASFLANFTKLFDEVNESSWVSKTPGTTRLRDVSSFAFSPKSRGGGALGEEDPSETESVSVITGSPQLPGGGASQSPDPAAVVSAASSEKQRSSPRALVVTGPSNDVKIRIALQEQQTFTAALAAASQSPPPQQQQQQPPVPPHYLQQSPRDKPQHTTAPSSLSPRQHLSSAIESSSTMSFPAAAAPAHKEQPPNQQSMEKRAADERLCRRIPLLLGSGDVSTIMASIAQFRGKYES